MPPDAYCLHAHFAPGGPLSFRSERHYLLYALAGTLRLEAEGQRWTLTPTRAAFIRADMPIEVTILSELTSASVLFASGYIAPPTRALSVFDVSPLARELIKACRDWGEDGPPLSPLADQLFTTLASVIAHLSETPSPCVIPVPRSTRLQRAVTLTEERAHDAVTFDEIAVAANQSPRALARRFSDEMGMTWRETLRRIRIIRAVEALAMEDTPVTQIAFNVGYNSLSAFNAAFRDLMGVTPTQYRDSLRDPRL
ncbi:AraC family transcriptional regulator [Pontivivens insulae]|uniref:HTH-type transcriptional regulator NimR n=1 Tax=Pontivivens insulae TaxID=1639689 RepID=A0A2R8A7W9_9RHOB|nr:AraC family transcriptional regulator [Pontivivens insulae]RED18404.1 AraC-like DNA-binding protein [Pontivivens insulae]SPF28302.1 HTH-type transcriptional regulator NimR [Pontivivens insulae]